MSTDRFKQHYEPRRGVDPLATTCPYCHAVPGMFCKPKTRWTGRSAPCEYPHGARRTAAAGDPPTPAEMAPRRRKSGNGWPA